MACVQGGWGLEKLLARTVAAAAAAAAIVCMSTLEVLSTERRAAFSAVRRDGAAGWISPLSSPSQKVGFIEYIICDESTCDSLAPRPAHFRGSTGLAGVPTRPAGLPPPGGAPPAAARRLNLLLARSAFLTLARWLQCQPASQRPLICRGRACPFGTAKTFCELACAICISFSGVRGDSRCCLRRSSLQSSSAAASRAELSRSIVESPRLGVSSHTSGRRGYH